MSSWLATLCIYAPLLIIFPTLSFFVATRAFGLRARLARIAATGFVAAVVSLALDLAGLWRPLRESQVGSSHRSLVNWVTLVGTWIPATVAISKLMAVDLGTAARSAALAAVLYVVFCVAPYALVLYWQS